MWRSRLWRAPHPGNCSAAGTRGVGGTARGLDGTFVVNQVNGRWRKPIPIPGKLTFVYGGWVQSVSRPSAGNCPVGGWYENGGDQSQAFVASEVNGTWHNAKPVPGLANLGIGQVNALSCATAGNCSAAGWYHDSHGQNRAFVISKVNGTWHNAMEVPGMHGLHPPGNGVVTALSCARAGKCSAGGYYHATHYGLFAGQVFVANQG